MNKATRVRILLAIGWACFIGPVVLWPLTSFTIWQDEPQGVLALSWIAVVLTGLNILLTAEVKADTVGRNNGSA